ncbi:MAG: 1-acyl-sn-glycerol-3-phosphate acyltransferase [Lachnospiraceae bacterium]|nr:1-acyl-sn-glycerol-3-phosphate acyltransferase [Lachnospiraceae bacterium]
MIRFIVIILFVVIYLVVTAPVQLVLWIMTFCGKDVSGTAFRMTQWILGVLVKMSGARIDIRGMENIPEDRAVLFCANHRSYFDIISTYAVMPHVTGYLSKQQIANVPLLGGWLRLGKSVPLDRKNIKKGMQSIMKCVDLVNEGVDIFVFPEGTRSVVDGEFGEFHEASFKIAQRSGCSIIPVTLNGTREVFEAHFPRVTPHDVVIEFGEPVPYEKHIGEIMRQKISETYEKNRPHPRR